MTEKAGIVAGARPHRTMTTVGKNLVFILRTMRSHWRGEDDDGMVGFCFSLGLFFLLFALVFSSPSKWKSQRTRHPQKQMGSPLPHINPYSLLKRKKKIDEEENKVKINIISQDHPSPELVSAVACSAGQHWDTQEAEPGRILTIYPRALLKIWRKHSSQPATYP